MRRIKCFLRDIFVIDAFTGAVNDGQRYKFTADLVIKPDIYLLGRFRSARLSLAGCERTKMACAQLWCRQHHR